MSDAALNSVTDASTLPKEMQDHHYPILFDVEETHWWYLGRRRILESFVTDICSGAEAPPNILDVGCGTGANLKMLARYGAADGIDVSEQAVEFCRQRGLTTVKLGEAETLPYDDETFDLVTSLDVLEHLDDDANGLAEIYRVLKPGGHALLFVPAFMYLWGVQDDVSNHRRRYAKPELIARVKQAGFKIDLCSYANFTFFFPVLVVRNLMRWLKIRTETEYGINISPLNSFFAWLFASERWFIKRIGFPFGVSLLCVVSKPR